jgi:molybdopterin molybdotransferase
VGRAVGRAVTHRGIDPEEEAPLVPVGEYRERILDSVQPLTGTEVALADASGLVCTQDVLVPFDLPRFRASAMDGYAVRSQDVASAPVPLEVAGEVRMGTPTTLTVGAREAVAVPTGGVVPDGADAVVPIELCEVNGSRVTVLRPHPTGKHVRPAGEDARAGELLVPSGRRLRAPDVGALAAAGIASVSVRPRARVGVVSTGDELVRPGEPLGDAQIYDANLHTLIAAVREAGAAPVDGGTVADDPSVLVDALDALVDHVDAVVCSGGVSMGVHDPVKRAFEHDGDISFASVGMQPGRPQAFGTWRGVPFFGLPGNPVSVFVSFEVFVRAALQKMMGFSEDRAVIEATLDADLDAPRTRARYARVCVSRSADGTYVASPQSGHGSNLLATFARSDGLAVLQPGQRLRSGASCPVILIRAID